MKYRSLFLSFMVLGLVSVGSWATLPQTVHAETSGWWAPGQQYNYTFRLRGVDRHIRTRADVQLLLRDLLAYIRELQADLDDIEDVQDEVQVDTRPATDITINRVTLHGEITDFGESNYATVWFEYGRSSNTFSSQTLTERIRAASNGEFERRVTGLRTDTHYYFRAVARDDEGRIEYGTTRNFTTRDVISSDTDEEPTVTTRSATAVTDSRAILRGSVTMNDFENGQVFFVYGEDEDLVDEVADEYETYDEVEEEGRDLQKILVDSDLDGTGTYDERISSLDNDTEHFFNICVAYENEESDEVITCDRVRSFTTED